MKLTHLFQPWLAVFEGVGLDKAVYERIEILKTAQQFVRRLQYGFKILLVGTTTMLPGFAERLMRA